jgi:amino acid transporter
MMQKILLFTSLLLLNGTTYALGLRTVVTVDTIVKPTIIVPDSLYHLDSNQYEKRQIYLKKRNKIIKITTGILSGAIAANQYEKGSAFGLLFFGLLGIIVFLSLLWSREPKPLDAYLKGKAMPSYKKEGNPKYNDAWNYSVLFGFIGLICLILAFLSSVITVFTILSLLSIILAIVAFFLGFKGQYKSKKQKNRGILKGAIGVILPFSPFILIIFLSFIGVFQWGE